jgi:hypothetical protein
MQRALIKVGGGHSASGASSTDGGLVIDLSKYLNKITVNKEARIAHVGGGALRSEVDDATCPFGLATVAGTVASVSTPLSILSAELMIRQALEGRSNHTTHDIGILTYVQSHSGWWLRLPDWTTWSYYRQSSWSYRSSCRWESTTSEQ